MVMKIRLQILVQFLKLTLMWVGAFYCLNSSPLLMATDASSIDESESTATDEKSAEDATNNALAETQHKQDQQAALDDLKQSAAEAENAGGADSAAITEQLNAIAQEQAYNQMPPIMEKVMPGSSSMGDSLSKMYDTVSAGLTQLGVQGVNWGLYATPREGESFSGSPESYFLSKHINYFCSPESVQEQGLDQTGGSCKSNTEELQHADLRIASLLQPNVYSTMGSVAASEIVRNLTTPIPEPKMSGMVSNGITNNDDKIAAVDIFLRHASYDVARNSLNQMLVMRSPYSSVNGNTSMMASMAEQVNQRFQNASWTTKISQGTTDVVMREVAMMQAFQLWMDYMKYKQQERVEAILAVTLSNSLKNFNRLYEKIIELSSTMSRAGTNTAFTR
jgi:hypothetical protein